MSVPDGIARADISFSDGATVNPLRISLQGTRQHLNNFTSELKDATPRKRKQLYQIMLQVIAHKLVPSRPVITEPRGAKTSP